MRDTGRRDRTNKDMPLSPELGSKVRGKEEEEGDGFIDWGGFEVRQGLEDGA